MHAKQLKIPLAFKVSTVASTERPQQVAYIALRADYSEPFNPETELSEDQCGRILIDRLLGSHHRDLLPLDHPTLTLAVQSEKEAANKVITHSLLSWLQLLEAAKDESKEGQSEFLQLVSQEVRKWAPEVHSWWMTHRCHQYALAA
jgi:thymidylate synthase ThyX